MFLPFKSKESLYLSKKTYFLHCKPSYRPSTLSYGVTVTVTVCVIASLRPLVLQVMICPKNP